MRPLLLLAFALAACSSPAPASSTSSPLTVAQARLGAFPRLSPPASVLVTDGDSITAGYGLPAGVSWPDQVGLLAPRVEVHNVAVAGATLRERAAAASTDVDPLFDASRPSTVVAFMGVNDFYQGHTAADTVPILWAYCDARRAVGWRVVVASELPWGTAGNGERAAYNAAIRAGWRAHADALLDFAADPRLRDPGDASWFQADTVHPTVAGATVLADLAVREVGT